MTGPQWLTGLLAAVMLMIAACCAVRLAAWRWQRRITEADADGIHLLMGVAMAGMLMPRLRPLPGTAWEAVFAVAAAWFAWRAARPGRATPEHGWQCRHPLPHLVECAAMIYMIWAVPNRPARGGELPMPAMTGSGGVGTTIPALAVLLTVFMLGYVLWTTDRLAVLTRAKAAAATRSTAPGNPRIPVTVAVPAQARLPHAAQATIDSGDRQQHLPSRSMLAPRLAECYKIVMSLAMGYMLIMMI